MKNEKKSVQIFWRSASHVKNGPFTRFLIKCLPSHEAGKLLVPPFFNGNIPKFFDSEGVFHPHVYENYLNRPSQKTENKKIPLFPLL